MKGKKTCSRRELARKAAAKAARRAGGAKKKRRMNGLRERWDGIHYD